MEASLLSTRQSTGNSLLKELVRRLETLVSFLGELLRGFVSEFISSHVAFINPTFYRRPLTGRFPIAPSHTHTPPPPHPGSGSRNLSRLFVAHPQNKRKEEEKKKKGYDVFNKATGVGKGSERRSFAPPFARN